MNLYNERPAWLDLAHQKLDAAAAEEAKAAKVKQPKASRQKHADEML